MSTPLERFDYGWAADIPGVQLAPEQFELYEHAQHSPQMAIAVSTVSNPAYELGETGAEEVLISQDFDGGRHLVLVPALVEFDPEFLGTEDLSSHEEYWRRYQSLPGREIQIAEDCEYYDWISGYRLWNLWPITETQAPVVFDEVNDWLRTDYDSIWQWYECRHADSGQCPRWHGEYRESFFTKGSHGVYLPAAMPSFSFLDADLQQVWERLLRSSQRNGIHALNIIPPDLREAVRLTERNYSPWLWL